ncbi:MAG: succinyl-diaminopimelate desuccinylase [Pseudomonadota bacterium]
MVNSASGAVCEATLDLASQLIAMRSVTPNDAGCQPLLQERLTRLGFRCTDLPFGDTQNFWAEYGSEGPLLVFAGHTDVVPSGPEEDWSSPPFAPEVRGDDLYGRGAADMKGSLAAMITACERIGKSGQELRGSIGFLITSDEEGPATHGTVKVMEWLAQERKRIDYCIVGEPSSAERLGDTLRVGRRGSLSAKIKVKGRQGHVAYPEKASNPVHTALPALDELRRTQWDTGNEYFPPTSFQITEVTAGSGAGNVIPGELTVACNFRYCTEQSAATLKQRVAEILLHHNVDSSIDWTLSGEPFLTRDGNLIRACQEVIHELTGLQTQPSTGGGTSDGRFIAPSGAEVVELGPRNATIHQIDERVSVSELATLSHLYEHIVVRLLA